MLILVSILPLFLLARIDIVDDTSVPNTALAGAQAAVEDVELVDEIDSDRVLTRVKVASSSSLVN